ncbi:MAG: small multi-drug export protein [Maledivibacter sp.]|jgi:uncharacterized membrane protein|nr:small multi-drug export protein [Maledivibacter sp.]
MGLVDFLSRELRVFLLSTLPIIELRGAIPYGIAVGMNPIHAAFLCIVGSMVPVPFLLFLLKPFFTKLRRIYMIREFEIWLIDRTERRAGNIKKYSILGLVLFVAIPLPSTGVWTGAIAAAIFNLRSDHAFFAILLGNIIAAILLTILSRLAILNL